MQSTILEITFAVSSIGSPLPSCVSLGDRNKVFPPKCVIPTSNETLVLVEDLSNIRAKVLFCNGV